MDKNQTYQRALRIIEAAEHSVKDRRAGWELEELRLHTEGYAEPGYTDPECGIIATANWNSISHYDREQGKHIDDDNTLPRVCALFEKLGIEIEWNDEWCACSECGKLFRTQADSYGWQRSYYQFECDLVCHECVDPVEVLADLEGKPHTALTIDTINPEDHGYVKANDEEYQNGWYGGQDDDPDAIAESLENHGITRYLFQIDSVGQFDLRFSVWVHEDEADLLNGQPEGKCKEDPANVLKRGLQGASKAMGELQGDGIKYSKVNADGTADARMVSPEEFVAGVK